MCNAVGTHYVDMLKQSQLLDSGGEILIYISTLWGVVAVW